MSPTKFTDHSLDPEDRTSTFMYSHLVMVTCWLIASWRYNSYSPTFSTLQFDHQQKTIAILGQVDHAGTTRKPAGTFYWKLNSVSTVNNVQFIWICKHPKVHDTNNKSGNWSVGITLLQVNHKMKIITFVVKQINPYIKLVETCAAVRWTCVFIICGSLQYFPQIQDKKTKAQRPCINEGQ